MVSRYLAEHLRTNCVQKIFSLRPSNMKNTRNSFKIVQKLSFLTFAILVIKFRNKNHRKLDKNPRNFSFYQK